MRILAGGNVGIGTAAPATPLHVEATTDSDVLISFVNCGSTNESGMNIGFPNSPDNNTSFYMRMTDGGGAVARMYTWSDGDLANHDGVYGTISDEKFKQDIEDVRSYWDDFKQVRYRKWRDISDVKIDPDAPYRLGLVAQELEPIFPALVTESPDTSDYPGATFKWVKSSIVEGPIMASAVSYTHLTLPTIYSV